MGSVILGKTSSSMREMANMDIIIGVSLFEFMVITPDGGRVVKWEIGGGLYKYCLDFELVRSYKME